MSWEYIVPVLLVLAWYAQRKYRRYWREREHDEILRRRYGRYSDE